MGLTQFASFGPVLSHFCCLKCWQELHKSSCKNADEGHSFRTTGRKPEGAWGTGTTLELLYLLGIPTSGLLLFKKKITYWFLNLLGFFFFCISVISYFSFKILQTGWLKIRRIYSQRCMWRLLSPKSRCWPFTAFGGVHNPWCPWLCLHHHTGSP